MRFLLRRHRMVRRMAVALAAAPLLQLSACQTGTNMILADVVNSIPATLFNIGLNLLLAPIYSFLGGGSAFGG